jgi:predicted nucleotidyltransferase
MLGGIGQKQVFASLRMTIVEVSGLVGVLYTAGVSAEGALSSKGGARDLALRLADAYAAIATVETVVLSGSQTSGLGDGASDIDLYVYSRSPISLEERTRVATGARRAEIGNAFWEPGDEWVDGPTGISIDVMFRDCRWIEEQLDRVLKHHQASIGYSTCFWYNVLHSESLFDRYGWFGQLQERARVPYPEELRAAIIAKNLPLLRHNMSSYIHQMELAIQRGDLVSLNHRCAVLLASYFDVLFALNRQPHPGEKRLVKFAEQLCSKRPANFRERIEELLAALPRTDASVIEAAERVVEGLEKVVRVGK